jgi:hypothetical protein
LRERLRRRTFLSLDGSSLVDASSANSSSICRSLMVSWGPGLVGYKRLRFLFKGTIFSFSTPSFSFGRYWRLSIDFLRERLGDADSKVDEDTEAGSEASTGDRACSLRKARNSAGAISGWRLAGTQKRWRGSSAGLLGPSVAGARLLLEDELEVLCSRLELPWAKLLLLLLSVAEIGEVERGLPGQCAVGDAGGDWLGRSGSMVRAPGVVERRLRSRRTSTSR